MVSPPPTDHELTGLLREVMHALRRETMAALEPYGLTPHQGRAFVTLGRHADESSTPLRLKDLAERLRIAPRSATEVVDRLEEQGLLRRTPAPNDRRATALELTEHGERVFEKVRAARADLALLADLSDTDRRRLGSILRRLLATRA